MPIHFSRSRLEAVAEAHERWWEGTLDRPLLSVILPDAYPADRKAGPLLTQANCHEFDRSPEDVIDAWDAWFSSFEFLGDAYPTVSLDVFGPGVLSAFCGGLLDNSSGQVWFRPKEKKDLKDISVRYDPDSPWAKRIRAICRAGAERWEGLVVIGMPDLGGVLDVAASLRGTCDLLTDLIDEPEEVDRLREEIRRAWYEAYRDFSAAMGEGTLFTDWNGILSRTPSYILQCDFSAMIGPASYDRFVLPDIRKDTEALGHTIYHLDGTGALHHLDSILSLPSLNAVQWVPGAGAPPSAHWPDVFRRIGEAGKRYMIVDGPDQFVSLQRELHGTPFCRWYLSAADRRGAEELLTLR